MLKKRLFTRRIALFILFGLLFTHMVILSTLADLGSIAALSAMTIEADKSSPTAEADLSLINIDSSDPVMVGEDLTYVISVNNNGPDNASNVTVFDTLPQGVVTFVSATPSQGSCSGNDSVVTCLLGSLANGETAIITIIVIPTTSGRFTNVANVSSAGFDPNTENDRAAEQTIVIGEFDIYSVSPAYGLNDVPTPIYIYGSGFEQPLTLHLGQTVLDVTYVDPVMSVAFVPAGLAPGSYDCTVTTAAGQVTLEDAYQVLPAANMDDLLSSSDWLWTDPSPIRVGYSQSSVGMLVQYFGGEDTIDGVAVEFRLYSSEGDFLDLLGSSLTPPLAPFATESTEPLIWEPQAAGDYRVCATIDPDDEVAESDEGNNRICRDIIVLPPDEDNEPPEVELFLINDGAQTTSSQAAILDVTATDHPIAGGSGVRALKYIEFEYIYGAQRWVPVQRSGWLEHELARVNYPWTLIPTYGIRYMEVWAVDQASNISENQSDNISLAPGVAVIDLLPEEQTGFVAQHGVVLYRIVAYEGQSLQAILTPVSGEPDLYIWSPTGELHYSNNQTGVETVVVQAENRATYQIEVHGVTDAEYRLTFSASTAHAHTPSLQTGAVPRPTPEAPAVPLDDWPEYYNIEPLLGEPSSPSITATPTATATRTPTPTVGVTPTPTSSLNYKIYLPMSIR